MSGGDGASKDYNCTTYEKDIREHNKTKSNNVEKRGPMLTSVELEADRGE